MFEWLNSWPSGAAVGLVFGWALSRYLRQRRQAQRARDNSVQVQIGEREIR